MSEQYLTVMDQSAFRPTPLALRYSGLVHTNRWHAWAQYHIPDAFEGLTADLRALHERVVIEDKTPMHFFAISGRDAVRFLNDMTPRDFSKVPVGVAKYTPWLDDDGKVIIDTPVCRLDETTYVNIGGPIGNWLNQHSAGYDVDIADVSDQWAVMPVHGPRARATIEGVTRQSWSDVKYQHGRRVRIDGCNTYVWRIGYNAQTCFELHTSFDDAPRVYDAVVERGRQYGILNLGQNAVHHARVEAGIVAPGWEYARAGPDANIAAYVTLDADDMVSPLELGLGRLIEFDKPEDFIGKKALEKEREHGGPSRRLVGLELDWRDIVALYEAAGVAPEISRLRDPRRHVLRRTGTPVGKASSLTWNPIMKRLIALGLVRKDLTALGTRLAMDWVEHGTRLTDERIAEVVHGPVNATVVPLPFVNKSAKFNS